jgi:hypothetical protein
MVLSCKFKRHLAFKSRMGLMYVVAAKEERVRESTVQVRKSASRARLEIFECVGLVTVLSALPVSLVS